MPDSPISKAQVRMAMDLCSFQFEPVFYRMLFHTGERTILQKMMLGILKDLDKKLRDLSPAGPFWMGEQFTLADVVFAPFLDRCAHH
jgi:glutathione S-transferase